MSIQSCYDALDLVGKTCRPAYGTEKWAFAAGHPRPGIVTGVYFPDVDHPYVVFESTGVTDYMYPFELDVLSH